MLTSEARRGKAESDAAFESFCECIVAGDGADGDAPDVSYSSLVVSITVAFFVGRFLFRILFDGRDDFFDCLRLSFTPDIISLFRGEYWQDFTQSLKLSGFVLGTGISGVMVYTLMSGTGLP